MFLENLENLHHSIGFEVLTAVVMKSTVFWDIMPFSLLTVDFNGLHGVIYQNTVFFKAIVFEHTHAETGLPNLAKCYKPTNPHVWNTMKIYTFTTVSFRIGIPLLPHACEYSTIC
jgi:hypothetical protein